MRKHMFFVAAGSALALAIAGCGSSGGGGGTPDMMMSSGGPDLGGTWAPTTVAGLRSSGVQGSNYAVMNGTMIVSMSYSSGAKWKGYFQDTGMANGIDLYCNSTARSQPCKSMAAMSGMKVSIWGPLSASPYGIKNLELIPLKVTTDGMGTVTYKDNVPSSMVGESNASAAGALFGTPILLQTTDGPWVVTNTTPASELNSNYVTGPDGGGTCTKGPKYSGFEVVGTNDPSHTTIMVTGDWYKSITFATDAACQSMGQTLITNGMKFSKLGGVVDGNALGTPQVVLEPTSTNDYTLM